MVGWSQCIYAPEKRQQLTLECVAEEAPDSMVQSGSK